MNGARSHPKRKIPLEEALKTITKTIVSTAEQSGVDAESLNLEMQFSLDFHDGKIEPVVYTGEVPPGISVHRLSFRVGVHCVDTESERVRRELEELTSDFGSSDDDGEAIDIDDEPPEKRRGSEPDGVLVDEPKTVPKKKEGPRIIVPAKPVLKLRHASDVAKKTKEESSDERQAAHFEREYSIPEDQPVKEQASEGLKSMANPSSRFVIFDHQRVQGRLAGGGVSDDDEVIPDIEA